MASPELAVAKAALCASLFKADPVSLSRQAVEALFPQLDATVVKCSRQNVQICKNWIVSNVAVSTARCTNLAKYLVALSRNFAGDTSTRPSIKRKRLHILYILSDALHHTVTRSDSRLCADAWAAHVVTLVAAAASFDKHPKHQAKLKSLVSLWEEKNYFSADLVSQFRAAVANSGSITATTSGTDPSAIATFKVAKDAPYTLPSSHGDSSTPWYDLPAGTWLPHLTPNSARPMMPDLLRPIQLSSGPADASLVDAIKKLLRGADRIYASNCKTDTTDSDVCGDISELGELFVVDEITGDVLSGDTYYGWSRPFCEKMKARRKQQQQLRNRKPGFHSRSRSSSRSPSPLSRSDASFRGRRSESFSPSRKRRRRYSSDSRSRSRSRTPSPRRDRNRSRSTSPANGHSRRQQQPPQPSWPPYNNQHHPPPQGDFGLPPPAPPPPPPTGYQGQWPLPPPPLLPHSVPPNWTPDPAVMSQMMAAWASSQGSFPQPPPPPPAAAQQPWNHQQGWHNDHQQGGYHSQGYHQGLPGSSTNERRGNHNNYRGRGGGYDKGRRG